MPSFATYLLSGTESGQPLAPHFGITGIGLEDATATWPSDSLFAALITQAGLLGTRGEDFIAAMTNKNTPPPMRHSSLFPRIGSMLLLPRPMLELKFPKKEQRDSIGKGFKKVRWLSPKLFQAVCEGRDLTEFHHVTLQHSTVWVSADEAKTLPEPWAVKETSDEGQRARAAAAPLWKVDSIPHVAVDRSSSASAYYEAGRVFFTNECGLALLVDYADEQQRPLFEQLLSMLGDSGIGGRRSIGYGQFTWAAGGDIEFSAQAPNRAVTLSRFLPKDKGEVAQMSKSLYQLVEVGGWAQSPQGPTFMRKQVTMLAEGAVLPTALSGQVIDVCSGKYTPKPNHEIWRSGLALTVPATVLPAEGGQE